MVLKTLFNLQRTNEQLILFRKRTQTLKTRRVYDENNWNGINERMNEYRLVHVDE